MLRLAYVAAGRTEGYAEAHINSWDVSAGLLLVEEASGRINDFWTPGAIGNGNGNGNEILAPPFFAHYRVFTRVPAGSCGLRREPFLPPPCTFYSPFAHSLSDPPHPGQAEVRKTHPLPLYKSTGYARTNQSVFLWHW